LSSTRRWAPTCGDSSTLKRSSEKDGNKKAKKEGKQNSRPLIFNPPTTGNRKTRSCVGCRGLRAGRKGQEKRNSMGGRGTSVTPYRQRNLLSQVLAKVWRFWQGYVVEKSRGKGNNRERHAV